MALQVIGLSYSTSVEGAIIFAIVPIIVKVIASVFLKEKATWLENIFICMTVAALVFMIIMGATRISRDPLGTVLLMLSSISMALSNVFMRYTRNDYKPIEITFSIVIIGFVAFNIAIIIQSIICGETAGDYFAPLAVPQVFIAGGYLGIGCILLSAHLMSYMLSKICLLYTSLFIRMENTSYIRRWPGTFRCRYRCVVWLGSSGGESGKGNIFRLVRRLW